MSSGLPVRTLGRTGLKVTHLDCGALELLGLTHEAGPSTRGFSEAEAILNAVLDSGINFIDTASRYGLPRSTSAGTCRIGAPSTSFPRSRPAPAGWMVAPSGRGNTLPTTAYGRYHNLRDVAGQPVEAPRTRDSCSVTAKALLG